MSESNSNSNQSREEALVKRMLNLLNSSQVKVESHPADGQMGFSYLDLTVNNQTQRIKLSSNSAIASNTSATS